MTDKPEKSQEAKNLRETPCYTIPAFKVNEKKDSEIEGYFADHHTREIARAKIRCRRKYATQGRYFTEDEALRLIVLAIKHIERGTRDWDELTAIVDKFGKRALV